MLDQELVETAKEKGLRVEETEDEIVIYID